MFIFCLIVTLSASPQCNGCLVMMGCMNKVSVEPVEVQCPLSNHGAECCGSTVFHKGNQTNALSYHQSLFEGTFEMLSEIKTEELNGDAFCNVSSLLTQAIKWHFWSHNKSNNTAVALQSWSSPSSSWVQGSKGQHPWIQGVDVVPSDLDLDSKWLIIWYY